MGGHVGCTQYKGPSKAAADNPVLLSNQAEHLGAGYNHLKEKWPFHNSAFVKVFW